MCSKRFLKAFSRIPFCAVVAAQSHIVECRFQFIVVQFRIRSLHFNKVYRGNSKDFAAPFLTFLGSLGAKVEIIYYGTRSGFELIAARTPELKRIRFHWDHV